MNPTGFDVLQARRLLGYSILLDESGIGKLDEAVLVIQPGVAPVVMRRSSLAAQLRAQGAEGPAAMCESHVLTPGALLVYEQTGDGCRFGEIEFEAALRETQRRFGKRDAALIS
jgi:hypothetical protein